MSEKTRLSNLAVNAQAKAVAELLNGGFFDVLTGEPSDETRLSRSELAATAFGAPKDGLLKANSIAKTLATATGVPTRFRISTKDEAPVIEGSAENLGLIKGEVFVQGQPVNIIEYTHRVVKGA